MRTSHVTNRLRLIRDYYLSRTMLTGLPVHLKIELTNFCNLDCRMCVRRKMNRHVGFMELGLCYEILTWAASHYCEFVYVHFMGEALYHPDLPEIVRMAHMRGLRVGLSTNGTLLDEDMSRELIRAELDLLVVAIDSPHQRDYEFLRTGASWCQVMDNVGRFARMLKTTRSRTILFVQMTYCDLTIHDWSDFVALWQGIGLSPDQFRVVIKQWDDWAGQLREIREWNEKTPPDVHFTRNACALPWRELSIQWDGTVVPCSRFFDKQIILGRVGMAKLTEIWNSSEMIEFRRWHVGHPTPQAVPVCQSCPRQPMRLWSFIFHNQFKLRLRHYRTSDGSPKLGLS